MIDLYTSSSIPWSGPGQPSTGYKIIDNVGILVGAANSGITSTHEEILPEISIALSQPLFDELNIELAPSITIKLHASKLSSYQYYQDTEVWLIVSVWWMGRLTLVLLNPEMDLLGLFKYRMILDVLSYNTMVYTIQSIIHKHWEGMHPTLVNPHTKGISPNYYSSTKHITTDPHLPDTIDYINIQITRYINLYGN